MKSRAVIRLLILSTGLMIVSYDIHGKTDFKTKGQEALDQGNYDAALKWFQKYAESEPDDYHPYNRLGWTYYNLRRYQEALESFIKSAGLQENKGNYQGLGDCYMALGRYADAVNSYKKANSIEDDSYAWRGMAYAYLSIGSIELALQSALKWSQLRPDDAEALIQAGGLYMFLEQFHDALESYHKANALRVDFRNYIGMAQSYTALERYEEAVKTVMTGMNLAADSTQKAGLNYTLAYVYAARGKYREAWQILGDMNTLGARIQLAPNGIRLLSVIKGGPADLSGMKAGDIIQELNGRDLSGLISAGDFIALLQSADFGSVADMKINRGGLVADWAVVIGIPENLDAIVESHPGLRAQRENMAKEIPGNKLRIAVIDLDAYGVPETEVLVLSDRLRFELFKSNRYTVLERNKMQEIIEELGFQQTGYTSDAQLIEIGKMLAVQHIIGGSIGKVGSYYTATIRKIDVETGEIVAIVKEDVQGTMDDFLTAGIRRIAGRLIN